MIEITNEGAVFKFKFTKGVSLNNIELVKKEFVKFIDKEEPSEALETYFNTTEFFPSTKKYDNTYCIDCTNLFNQRIKT